MLDLARLAGALDLPVEPTFVDRMVRWQLELRDRVHAMEQGVESMIERAQVVVPDLTVLSTEPVAHTESSGFGWRDDPIQTIRPGKRHDRAPADPALPAVATRPVGHHAADLSLFAELFGLCNRGTSPLWRRQGRVARRAADRAVPSLGGTRLRPGPRL